MDSSEKRFTGSCLCGGVTYAFDVTPRATVACHCSRCRKTTGGAFGTWALVPLDSFRWLTGAEQIAEFASSDHARRLFCRQCGTTLGSLTTRRPTFMHLAAGTLDETPQMRIDIHAHVSSKAPWYEIADSIPQHAEEPTKKA